MIKNITFTKVLNDFQTWFQNGMKYINNNDKIFAPAYKSRNIFLLYKIEHKKLLTKNITECYKKSRLNKFNEIGKDPKCIAEEHNIEDRT